MDDDRAIEQGCCFVVLAEVSQSDRDVGEICADLTVKFTVRRDVCLEDLAEQRHSFAVSAQGGEGSADASPVGGYVWMVGADGCFPDAQGLLVQGEGGLPRVLRS